MARFDGMKADAEQSASETMRARNMVAAVCDLLVQCEARTLKRGRGDHSYIISLARSPRHLLDIYSLALRTLLSLELELEPKLERGEA